MDGQPKPAFYAVVGLVVVALIGFAIYRSDIFAPKPPGNVPEPIKRDMQFHFVDHVEEVLKLALLDRSAAGEKTTERAGRESKPLPEPEPAPAAAS